MCGIHIEVVVVVHVLLVVNLQVCREVDIHFPCLIGILRCHNDDTIRSPCTIDSRGGGILQDRDTLDIELVKVLQTALRGQSVHDQQRGGVGIERGSAAYLQVITVSRQSSHLTFKRRNDIGIEAFGKFIGRDSHCRPSHLGC